MRQNIVKKKEEKVPDQANGVEYAMLFGGRVIMGAGRQKHQGGEGVKGKQAEHK